VFGRNLQRERQEKVGAREECHWSHACLLEAARFKCAGGDPMAFLECSFCVEKRAPYSLDALTMGTNACDAN
jgi:hypothetical protein